MSKNFNPPKGTRDFLPDELYIRKKVKEKIESVFELYGYEEVATPVFEYLDFLTKKGGLGEEAIKDIYKFQDKSGRWLGLRFDMTTPIVRLILNHLELSKPIKWYYITNLWRYEQPQKGRYREFFQAGIENIGFKSPEIDAEILAIVNDTFKKLKIPDFEFKINSREILNEIVKYYDISKKEEFFRILDKRDKLDREEWVKEISKFFKDKNKLDDFLLLEQYSLSELIDFFEKLNPDVINYLLNMIEYAKEYNIPQKRLHLDVYIVRGLEYYTGFIFETISKKYIEFKTIAGGGRYDNLFEVYGGPKLPATGMAIGFDRVVEIYKLENKIKKPPRVKVLICPLKNEKKYILHSIYIANILRNNDIKVDIESYRTSLKKKISYANSMKIPYIIIIGNKEIFNKQYTIKNLETGEQMTDTLENIIKLLKN